MIEQRRLDRRRRRWLAWRIRWLLVLGLGRLHWAREERHVAHKRRAVAGMRVYWRLRSLRGGIQPIIQRCRLRAVIFDLCWRRRIILSPIVRLCGRRSVIL